MIESFRLNVLISKSGYCSRRKADELIADGKVTVDGVVITELGAKFPQSASIIVEGKELTKAKSLQYIVFNKPRLVITSKKDEKGRDTIYKYLPDNMKHLNPVGRLDYDTSGLLLLTDDGDLLYKLTHPKFNVARTYRITCKDRVGNYQVKKLLEGVSLEGGITTKADQAYKQGDYLFLTLHEGRYHHVKRMVEAVGNKVYRMKRTEYAGIALKGIKPGSFRRLSSKEVAILKRKPRS